MKNVPFIFLNPKLFFLTVLVGKVLIEINIFLNVKIKAKTFFVEFRKISHGTHLVFNLTFSFNEDAISMQHDARVFSVRYLKG